MLAVRVQADWVSEPFRMLQHVGYVSQPVSTVSRDKLLTSGQTDTISGKIVGVYLFRSTEAPEAQRSEA
jgi:hypothetical protein